MNKPLRELADIYYGKSPSEVLSEDGPFPVVGTGGVYGSARHSMFEGPAIVVARKGSLGNPQLMRGPFWPVDTTYAVIPKNKIDPRWLYYNLANFDLTKLNEATGVPSINRDWLYRITFDDPGTSAQKKIGDILQDADESIIDSEALLAKYQQIKSGLMHDLFKRGVTKDGKLRPPRKEAPELYWHSPIAWIPKEWDCCEVEALLARVPNSLRSGPFGSSLLKSELVENGIPLLGIDNIFPERFEGTYRRFVSQRKFRELQRYSVRPNDVVITIMGTVGRCCVLPDDIGEALSTKHVWTMTLDQSQIIPELVCWQLNYAIWVQKWFNKHSQGAVMDAIQSSTLRTLRLPLPPMKEQEVIYGRYAVCHQRVVCEEAKLKKLLMQKQGLMHDLLTGRVRVKA